MRHLKDFFAKLPERAFKKGDVLLHQDEAADEAFYISDGFVKAYTIADFEEFCARSSREAMSDGVVRVQQTSVLEKELTKDNAALLGLVRYTMSRNDELAQTLENILQSKSDTKLINYLALLVQRFGQESKTGIVTLPFPLSHAQLASMVGTTRETMTVQIRQLTKKGILRAARRGIFRNRQSGFEINLEKLRELTDV